MDFVPRKRVGSPASVRGVRGPYLNIMIMYIVGGLFFILILLIFPFPMLLGLLLTVVAIGFLIYKYTKLKTLSKGDLSKSLKNNCRKTFVAKSKN